MEELKAYKLLHPRTHQPRFARSVIVHEAAVGQLHPTNLPYEDISNPVTWDPWEEIDDVDGAINSANEVDIHLKLQPLSAASEQPPSTVPQEGTDVSEENILDGQLPVADPVADPENENGQVDSGSMKYSPPSSDVEVEEETPAVRRSQRTRPSRENWVNPPYTPTDFCTTTSQNVWSPAVTVHSDSLIV